MNASCRRLSFRFLGILLPHHASAPGQAGFYAGACPDLQQVQNALTKIIKLTGLLHLRVTEKTNGSRASSRLR
eukprot:gene367-1757_t